MGQVERRPGLHLSHSAQFPPGASLASLRSVSLLDGSGCGFLPFWNRPGAAFLVFLCLVTASCGFWGRGNSVDQGCGVAGSGLSS